jgi:hypothetical protein
MKTEHWSSCRISRTFLAAVCLSQVLSGCVELNFDNLSESTGQTYTQYASSPAGSWVDLKGASDISHRTSSTRDGYDAWWHFTISESDFLSIVRAIAKDNQGPAEIQLMPSADPPQIWTPESEVPEWWVVNGGQKPQSVHWCFMAGDAARHHGWLFVYNPDSNHSWCWHWNHQWSSSECQ